MFCSALHNWHATYTKDTTGASAVTASYAAIAPGMTVARLAGDLAVSCRPLPGSR